MSWRPVLEGAEAEAARVAIARLAEVVAADPLDDPTLIRGAAGAALLHGTLARGGEDGAAERAHAALAQSLARIGDASPGPWLGTGFVGVAWVMHHLADVLAIDDDALAPIDEMVTEVLGRDAWPYGYELWEGLVGIGVYARARGRGDLVARVVAHLAATADRNENGATWWSRAGVDLAAPGMDPRGYHELGLAHGVAGAIVLLADATADGIGAGSMAADATRWLLANDRLETAPRFPGAIGLDIPADHVRNGWCHGDLAVAIAAVRSGVALGVPAYVDHGHAIARAMAVAATEVPDFDTAFCHGAAGRAHMFNRLGHALADDALLASARRYHLDTLARIDRAWPSRVALTNGAIGIALSLHAAVSTDEPAWDQVLLTALPPG